MQYNDRWMSNYIPWLDDKDKRRNSTALPTQAQVEQRRKIAVTLSPSKTFFTVQKLTSIYYINLFNTSYYFLLSHRNFEPDKQNAS
jgi:hypothetical protein